MGRFEARATVDWKGFGGSVESASGLLATATAAQVELGGPGGATNPEELFAAAHANCFTSTITSMARSRGIELAHVVTEARVRLEWSDDAGDHRLAASDLAVRLTSHRARGRPAGPRGRRDRALPGLPGDPRQRRDGGDGGVRRSLIALAADLGRVARPAPMPGLDERRDERASGTKLTGMRMSLGSGESAIRMPAANATTAASLIARSSWRSYSSVAARSSRRPRS